MGTVHPLHALPAPISLAAADGREDNVNVPQRLAREAVERMDPDVLPYDSPDSNKRRYATHVEAAIRAALDEAARAACICPRERQVPGHHDRCPAAAVEALKGDTR
jgi:hypothetical protein